MFLGHLGILRFLDQIPEDGQNDSGHLLFDRITEDVRQDRYDVELVHFLGQQRVERQNPQAENQLVLDLEVDASREDGQQRRYAIDRHKGEPVLVDAQHHLEASADGLDVLIVLRNEINIDTYIEFNIVNSKKMTSCYNWTKKGDQNQVWWIRMWRKITCAEVI